MMTRSSTIRPGRGVMTRTRSARKTASGIEWVMKKTVWPVSAMIFSNSACIASRVMASTAPKGSSINKIDGSDTKARAIPTL